jgi:hypothetical protein
LQLAKMSVVIVNMSFNFFLRHSLNLACFSLLFTTGCKRDFLQSLPELVAIGGLNINAGNDEEQGGDDEVFVDRQEEQADAAAPAAQADAAPAHAPEPHLEQGLQDFIEELADLDLNDADMKINTKRIEHLPVNGAPTEVPTAIHAVITVLEPGTQLSTITSHLSKNQQDGEVRAMLAPELNLAQKLLPHKKMVRQNPSIGNTLPLAIQEALNQDETDRDPFHPKPISKSIFSLANRGDVRGADGPLDPADLGLVPGAPGDKFMLHKVDVSNTSGTVPCFVVIFFFLEERTQKVLHSPHFERKLPGCDRTPPPSPDGPNRKRRAGGGFASFSSIFANLFAWTT